MNQIIASIKNHRSIRNYLEKDIPEEMLQEILEASRAMPTSINGQQIKIRIKRKRLLNGQEDRLGSRKLLYFCSL